MFDNVKKPTITSLIILFGVPVIFAVAMIGTNYMIAGPLMTAAGGTGTSTSYQVSATVGQSVQGEASSPSFSTNSGSTAQQSAVTVVLPPPSLNLNDVFVYPNPLKPGSGGKFDANTVTFKKLTDQATIKIYTYSGMLVATLNKTNTGVDDLAWDTKNEGGALVSSGIYIYLITNSKGEKAKGKFGIVR